MREQLTRERAEDAAEGAWNQDRPQRLGDLGYYREGFTAGAAWAEAIYRKEIAEEYLQLLRTIAKTIATTVDDPEELPEDILERIMESSACTRAEVAGWADEATR